MLSPASSLLKTKIKNEKGENMGKKKVKEDGIYLYANNAYDVTGSSIFIRCNGKQILLECGMVQKNDYLENYRLNSEKFPFNPSEIDYVFIGHVHVDHIGLLGRLVREGFNGNIICSHATAMLMKPLLLNSAFILKSEACTLSYKYKRDYKPIYDEDDVYKVLDLVYEYDELHTEYILDDVVSFEWLENSHCLGARQLRLSLTNKLGVKEHILYTSDIGSLCTKNHYLKNTEIDDRNYLYAFMESTYGMDSRQTKKTREFDMEHLRVGIETTLERGGTFIMPCFSFSRTQEILTSLYEIFHDKDFKYNVIVDSMLSVDICNIYDQLLTDEDLELWTKVRNWENVRFITEKDESSACVKDHTPKIVISSSGFCTNGRILSYLHEYLSDENSMICFSGYIGDNNSYLSYKVKNYKENKVIKISGDPVKNKIDCMTLHTMSSHASHKDLIEFGSSLNTSKLVLVHGSVEAKNCLKEKLQDEICKKDKSFKVVASTKDMFLRL